MNLYNVHNEENYPPPAMRSLRWHAHVGDKTFIVYAELKNDAEDKIRNHTGSADAACQVRPSGYYDRATNTIVDAQDGPMSVIENWPTGRGY